MLFRFAPALVASLLLVAATPAPTLVQHAGNVLGSMRDQSADLSTLLASLRGTSARLAVVSGEAEILALHRDADRVDRSCEALSLKAGRLVEIAGELEVELGADR